MASERRMCVVVGRTRHKMMLAELHEAAKAGAAMIELRLDFLSNAPDFKRLLANRPGCQLVACARRPQEGGRWSGPEDARKMLLRQCIVNGGFDWVDLETDLADEIRRFKQVRRIVSYHNLREVPADLEAIYAKMCGQDPDVVKIAVMAQTPADNFRVLSLLQNAPKPTVAFCMGDLGFPSRLLSLKYGSPFLYCMFNKERQLAPGMPSFEDARSVYHASRIDADTAVYGVVGDPITHSLSPKVHNAVFRALGLNAVYLPFRVPKGMLPEFLTAYSAVPLRGLSVTIPQKEAAATAAVVRDSTVEQTHAANTLVRHKDGMHAHNTDYRAIMGALQANVKFGPDGDAPELSNCTALILGAGGAARAAAHALTAAGVGVKIANRTPERAEKLAAEVHGTAVPWHQRHQDGVSLVLNCTSVGMHPNVDDCPVTAGFLKPGMVVFDAVYTPETTLLIREARNRGCKVVTGVEMFVRQAGAQFQLFTGHEPPLELMGRILRRTLSPVNIAAEADAEAES